MNLIVNLKLRSSTMIFYLLIVLVGSVVSVEVYHHHSEHPKEDHRGEATFYDPASLSVGSYDDLHKYGGIGKKIHIGKIYDHVPGGYKHYYGNGGYGAHGLNKYTKMQHSDHYGAKHGGHGKYKGGHVYTRNRGYGYEKKYMFDKEYSTSNHDGNHAEYTSQYGDTDKGKIYSLDEKKKYSHDKFGGTSKGDEYGGISGSIAHTYEPKYHLITPHVTHYGMPTGGHDLDLGHHGLSLEHGIGGALGHHDLAHYSDHSPLYSDSQHIPVPGANVVYAPSPLTSATEGESVNTRKSIPLISTKLSPSPLSVPQSSTATDLYPLTSSSSNVERSAVHATPPALISTNNGVHYYSS